MSWCAHDSPAGRDGAVQRNETVSRWWPLTEPTPPPCRNCGHDAEYHTPNRVGLLICVAPVDGQMKCPCHEKGGYRANARLVKAAEKAGRAK